MLKYGFITCIFIFNSTAVYAQLLYGSYFGSMNKESIGAYVYDDSGFVYVAGEYTPSGGNLPNLPTNSLSYQSSYGGGYSDFYLAKYDKRLGLRWCTYIGGYAENPRTIGLKLIRNFIYVAFTTTDTKFSNPKAVKTLPNKEDLCIIKLDLNGKYIKSTYLGGGDEDYFHDWSVTENGELLIVGMSNSKDSIGTYPSYCPNYPGLSATSKTAYPFVMKIDTNLNILYGSYLGKNVSLGTSYNPVVTLDPSGSYYIGFTIGTNASNNAGWVTSGGHQRTIHGSWEGVITKFTSKGVLEWSTFLGGNSEDRIMDLFYDAEDETIVVYGSTESKYKLIDSIIFTKKTDNSKDGFIAKFSKKGTRIYCRYLGGLGIEEYSSWPATMRINKIGNDIGVLVNTGDWNGRSGISNNQAFNNIFLNDKPSGGKESILYCLNKVGEILYSGYVGGDNNDICVGFNSFDDVINIMGETNSFYGISTIDAVQDQIGGDLDIFLQRFQIPIDSKLTGLKENAQCIDNNLFIFKEESSFKRQMYITKDSFSDGTTFIDSSTITKRFKSSGRFVLYHFIKSHYSNSYVLKDTIELIIFPQRNSSLNIVNRFDLQLDSFALNDSIKVHCTFKPQRMELYNNFIYYLNGSLLMKDSIYNQDRIQAICSIKATKFGWNYIYLRIAGQTACDIELMDSFFVKSVPLGTSVGRVNALCLDRLFIVNPSRVGNVIFHGTTCDHNNSNYHILVANTRSGIIINNEKCHDDISVRKALNSISEAGVYRVIIEEDGQVHLFNLVILD